MFVPVLKKRLPRPSPHKLDDRAVYCVSAGSEGNPHRASNWKSLSLIRPSVVPYTRYRKSSSAHSIPIAGSISDVNPAGVRVRTSPEEGEISRIAAGLTRWGLIEVTKTGGSRI